MSRVEELVVEDSAPEEMFAHALYGAILHWGTQCLSQASLTTGLSIRDLRDGLQVLLKRGLVREVPGQSRASEEYLSYELDPKASR